MRMSYEKRIDSVDLVRSKPGSRSVNSMGLRETAYDFCMKSELNLPGSMQKGEDCIRLLYEERVDSLGPLHASL